MFLFVLGLVLFLGIHLTAVFASRLRTSLREKWGEGGWKGFYSVVSLAGFVLIVMNYGAAVSTSAVLYEPAAWLKHLNGLFMLAAAIIFAAYLLPAGRIKAAVKHPMILSVKIWAFGHLLANGSLAAILLFGSFLVWGVLVRISLKKRERAGLVTTPVAGPVKWDIATLVLGLVLYGAFVMGLHVWLFGVPPFAVG